MRVRPSPVDVAAAIVLAVVGVAEGLLGLTGATTTGLLLLTVLLVVAPVAFRRTHPGLALLVLLAGLVIQAAGGSDLGGGMAEPIALILCLYSAGAQLPLRRALSLLAAALAALAAVVGLGEGARTGNFVYAGTVVVLGWLSGRAVALARERTTLLAEQRSSQERSLMARELHDVVTHALSAMVIQASAERRGLPPGTSTAEALHAIEDQGREALRELRRLLGVLTLDAPADAPLAPQPGLEDLPRLVESARHHGLDVTLTTTGTPGQLGPGAELALYRVVQEALTNAGKHAGRRHAQVSLAWHDDEVAVEVLSHGRSGRGRRLPGSGFGLRSMAERVHAYGGVLNARPTSEGFRVMALLPLERA